MKLMIDIPENVIECAKSSPNYYPTYHFEKIWRAIANGIPLPKGHGRLVEVDKLCGHCGIRAFDCCGDCDKCEYYVVSIDDIREAKTIIEADKSEVDWYETDN